MQQGMSQQQSLSPQMRQSLEILQANTLELGQLLQQVSELNPALEIEQDHQELESPSEPDAEHDYENLSEFDDSWREEQILYHRGQATHREEEQRRDFLYNSIVAPQTLQQHLIDQLNHAAVDDEKYQTALYLIGCINDHGFLDSPLETLTQQERFSLKQMRSAQSLVQGFDPAGVATENLTESLLLQLQRLGRGGSLECRIVDQHLEDLARRKIADIARSLGVSEDAIHQAAAYITRLNPDPGAAFDPSSNPHVTPDLIIRQDSQGAYYAELTGDHLPRLHISNHYKDLLSKLQSDPKARKYLRDHIHEGRQIINALSLRQETLLKIGSEIIRRQPELLLHGKKKLKPMTMHELAESIGVHAATISRAVAGKYILTPHGLMELRSFFTSGYTTQQGLEISSTGVREAIQQLVSNEDTAKPLSDTAIEKQLKSQGVKVARRTIAKYRDQLGILPSHLRKRHG